MRTFLVPETTQLASMDCGPAALRSLLAGHRIAADYGDLRDACDTTVDGTSIDALEQLGAASGLECEQVLVPADHLFATEADALPAIVITKLPSGVPHFAVVWRQHGPFVQVMDPHVGRVWLRRQALMARLFEVLQPLAAEDWAAYARTDAFLVPLAARGRALGIRRSSMRALVAQAVTGEHWYALACLDAALRFVARMRGPLRARRRSLDGIVRALFARIAVLPEGEARARVPDRFWIAGTMLSGGEGEFHARGAIALHASGGQARERIATASKPRRRGAWRLLHRVRGEPLLGVSALLAILGAPAAVAQILAFRVVFAVSERLTPGGQRLGAVGCLLAVHFLTMLIGWGASLANARLGRVLELDLRKAFFEKLRRLPETYFRSRSTSDMVERAHALRGFSDFPNALATALRAVASLTATACAIAFLEPSMAPLVLFALVLGITVPVLVAPLFRERELALRTHAVAFVRLYLDSILGNTVVRAHGAERGVEQMHEETLVEWSAAVARYRRLGIVLEAAGSAFGLVIAVVALARHFDHGAGGFANTALVALWLAQLPALSTGVLHAVAQLPAAENAASRIFEVLDAREVSERHADATTGAGGVAILARGLVAEASGQPVLRGIDLAIEGGEHVAVVGRSGSGKSSILAVLLGLIDPSGGELRIDGSIVGPADFARLRGATAWVAPETRLWNGTVLDNVIYGATERAMQAGSAVESVEMTEAISHLPAGLQSRIGEGGVGLSGGEAQRLRLARARLRADARLVLLDEAFRGLPRAQRQRYMQDARKHWSGATLLVVTHDVDDTLDFDRVVVVEDGRIVEDGPPAELVRDGSRYAALVDEARAVRSTLLGSADWTRITVAAGEIRREDAA